MRAFAVALAVFFTCAAAAQAHTTNFPSAGVVVPGQSIGGIKIGMSATQVAQLWGHGYEVCTSCGKQLTWLFEYRGAEPLGAAVRFDAPSPKGVKGRENGNPLLGSAKGVPAVAPPPNSHVIAVFTLGSPLGWGAKGKVMMFDPISNVYNIFGSPGTVNCIGYTALTVKVGTTTMAFYSASGVVYGFALTAPAEPVCQ